jgi:hypothetical protein
MTAVQPRDRRRFRLATNDNETIVETDVVDVDGDDLDVEGHRLAANDNETVAEGNIAEEPSPSDPSNR